MTRGRIIAFGWIGAMLAGAAFLSFEVGPSLGHLPDAGHVIAHLILFGVLAGLLGPELGVGVTVMTVVLAGLGIEAVQMWGSGRFLPREAAFDMVVNGLGALAGLRNREPRIGGWLRAGAAGPWLVGAPLALSLPMSWLSGRWFLCCVLFAALCTPQRARWPRWAWGGWWLAVVSVWAAT